MQPENYGTVTIADSQNSQFRYIHYSGNRQVSIKLGQHQHSKKNTLDFSSSPRKQCRWSSDRANLQKPVLGTLQDLTHCPSFQSASPPSLPCDMTPPPSSAFSPITWAACLLNIREVHSQVFCPFGGVNYLTPISAQILSYKRYNILTTLKVLEVLCTSEEG